jgi:hypothetical protein
MAGTRKGNKGAAKKGHMAADEAMCMTCKVPRKMQNAKIVTTKNGRKMMKGVCPVCGTKMNRFIPNTR